MTNYLTQPAPLAEVAKHFARALSTLGRIARNVEKKFDNPKDHGALLKKFQTAILGD
jgi:hypothetical protein